MMRTRAERQALKAGFERLFPVSESIASQFRAVALAIPDHMSDGEADERARALRKVAEAYYG